MSWAFQVNWYAGAVFTIPDQHMQLWNKLHILALAPLLHLTGLIWAASSIPPYVWSYSSVLSSYPLSHYSKFMTHAQRTAAVASWWPIHTNPIRRGSLLRIIRVQSRNIVPNFTIIGSFAYCTIQQRNLLISPWTPPLAWSRFTRSRACSQGAMCKCFMARSNPLRPYPVVLKMAIENGPRQAEQDLNTELTMLQSLSHPNLAQLLGAGRTPKGKTWVLRIFIVIIIVNIIIIFYYS